MNINYLSHVKLAYKYQNTEKENRERPGIKYQNYEINVVKPQKGITFVTNLFHSLIL